MSGTAKLCNILYLPLVKICPLTFIYKNILHIIILFSCFALQAQEQVGEVVAPKVATEKTIEKRPFDRVRWHELSKNMVFKEKEKKEKEKKKEEKENNSDFKKDDLEKLTALGGILKYAIFGTIVLVAVFFLVKFLRNDFKIDRRVTQKNIGIEAVEENLPDSDLEAFIKQALQSGDYKLAIRFYYLLIIKELSIKNIIEWKRDKTNHAYLAELRQNHNDLFEPFKQMTLAFERVWYGGKHTPFGANHYAQLAPRFEGFIKHIKKNTI